MPEFDVGDTVEVHTKILEGEKERTQIFAGVVIARSGSGSREMFTVRRIVAGEKVWSGSSRSIHRGSVRLRSNDPAMYGEPSSISSETVLARQSG